MRRHKTVIFLTLGFLVGICILLYPAFSDFWNSKTQSRAITNYESVLEHLKPEDYAAIFETAHAYNKALYETDFPLKDCKQVPGYRDTLSITDNDMIEKADAVVTMSGIAYQYFFSGKKYIGKMEKVITSYCKDVLAQNANPDKKYAFVVDKSANKTEIKKAIEEIFGVKVKSVNTVNVDGKLKRQGKTQGYRSDYKKAYVTLTADSKAIEFFESLS